MTHCRLIAEKFGLDVIELKELIKTAAESGGEITETLLDGQAVSDLQSVELVVEAIKAVKNPKGYVLIDFPTSLP